MNKTILIVDDDGTTRKIINLYLKDGGYRVIPAIDGVDALEKIANEEVNLIITDVNMPQMDGIEFIRSLKSTPSYSAIPVVVLSTEAEEVKKKRGKEVCANLYLTKPVTKDRLLSEIGKLI